MNLYPRTRAHWIALTAGCLLLLAGLLAGLWLPTVVLASLEARLSQRGLRIVVADVDVGLNGVALAEPKLFLQGTKAPLFRAERLAVGVRWWDLSGGTSRALTRVQIEGGVLDADAASLERVLAKRGANAVGSGHSAELPRLDLHDVDILLRDAAGPLLRVEHAVLEVAQGRFSGSLKKLVIGALPDEQATAQRVQVVGVLEGRRPVLRRASAESAVLAWADEPAGARPSTFSRLRSFLASARPNVAPTAQGAVTASPSHRLWTDDARLSLPSLRIYTVAATGGQEKDLLRELRVELAANDQGGFSAEGRGSSDSGGTLAFKLQGSGAPVSLAGEVKLEDLSLALFEPALPPLPYQDLRAAKVSALLVLSAQGLSGVGFRGDLSLSGLAFAADGLARAPVGPIALRLSGEGTYTPMKRELVFERASAEVGPIEVGLSGTLAWPSGAYRVQVAAALPKSKCADVLAAVPVGVLDELSSIELSGDLSVGLDVYVDSNDLDHTKVDFDVHDGCRFDTLPTLLDLGRFTRPFVHTALEPDGTIFEFETGPGSPAWTPIELISPFMTQAAVAHEDGRFFSHHGFAEPEIAVALSRNLKAKAFRFGASTITMQLVKNVFLHRDKLLSRKVQEALITWWLEQAWDKRRILELYLNVIEYGPSIYGIRNAAWHYFGTIPMNLTPAQSAFLASILPSPKTFHEQYDRGELSPSMKNRLSAFLKHMRARDRIDDDALAFGFAELETFRFYRPEEPPPLPVEVRGSAAPLPFSGGPPPASLLDPWDTLAPPSGPTEDGSFGSP